MKTIVVCSIMFCASSVYAQQIQLPVKTVSIFKNGTCMFTKEGTVPVQNNVVRLPVPQAISSTYWLSTPNERLIKSVAYKNDNIKVKREASSFIDLMEINIGKTLSYELHRKEIDGKNSVALFSGKILGVQRFLNSVKLSDKNGTRFVPVSEIQSVSFSIEDAVDQKMIDSSARFAVITPTKSVSELALQEISLQSGVQWIPSYSMKLLNDKEARLEMKALIENFSQEDISNTDAEVVVGVPQLYFSKTIDPAATTVYTTFQNSNPGYIDNRSQMLSNVATAERFRGARTMDAGSLGTTPESYDISFDTESEQSNDIFVYKLGNLSVEKQSKASFPIFATTLEYKDVHDCDIPDFTNYEYTRNVSAVENTYDVFHSVELRNTTNYPLTTAGIVLTNDKGRFLAQDLLKYIPKGGKGTIRVSKAINITLKCSEEEIQRTDNVKRIAKINYHKMRIKGTVVAQNFDDKEVTIKIKKSANGTIVGGTGKVRKRSESFGVNPQSEITWEQTLKPGERVEIPYEYETLFR